MPRKPSDFFPTCSVPASGCYQQATGFNLNARGTTVPVSGSVRTVVTTTQKGMLELRYAPRSPKVSDKNTAL